MKSGLVFVMHQIIGTEGVIWFTALCVFLLKGFITQINESWENSRLVRGIHWILVETPFFPVQIAVGFYLGWKLYRRLRHRPMFWVWILPGVVLGYAVIALPAIGPWSAAASLETAGSLSHYLGWGCQPSFHCFDQLTVTLPFYTSVAYSIGALSAHRITQGAK
jgi:hypothetical protein